MGQPRCQWNNYITLPTWMMSLLPAEHPFLLTLIRAPWFYFVESLVPPFLVFLFNLSANLLYPEEHSSPVLHIQRTFNNSVCEWNFIFLLRHTYWLFASTDTNELLLILSSPSLRLNFQTKIRANGYKGITDIEYIWSTQKCIQIKQQTIKKKGLWNKRLCPAYSSISHHFPLLLT